jgi:hypothetical protein
VCETYLTTLREESLKVCEDRVVKKIFRFKLEEEYGDEKITL